MSNPKTRKRVLMSYYDELNGVPGCFIEEVEKTFDIVWEKDFEENPEKYSDIVGILVWRMAGVPKRWLEVLSQLKVVANIGVGYDKLDIPLIRSFGVKASNTPDVLSASTADLGMSLILTAGRDIVRYVNEYKAFTGKMLPINDMALNVHETTLGIVGMGRIGHLVAKRAVAFDMKILYHSRTQRPASIEESVGATYYSSLNEMLPHCDYVIVIVCLTNETRKMISDPQFKLMKKSAIFINISRGSTVDTDALVDALKSGEIHSAALDVTDPEPLPRDHELFGLPNVIITPHVGSQTKPTRMKMVRLALENIIAGVKGEKLPTEVLS